MSGITWNKIPIKRFYHVFLTEFMIVIASTDDVAMPEERVSTAGSALEAPSSSGTQS